jgi:hypothetical protein
MSKKKVKAMGRITKTNKGTIERQPQSSQNARVGYDISNPSSLSVFLFPPLLCERWKDF